MNITIITILLPYPLDSGGTQAQYNMIDSIRHEHHISLVFPENGHNSPEALKQLKALWPEVNFYSYSYFRQLCYLPYENTIGHSSWKEPYSLMGMTLANRLSDL